MTPRGRLLAGAGALLCLLAAAVLVLLALDARAWGTRITRDDLRFRAQPGHASLWASPALLPGDPAGALLGVSEPVDFRHAVQVYWLSNVGRLLVLGRDRTPLRFQAQADLERVLGTGRSAQERSTVANLLGVLTVTTPASDAPTQQQTFRRAAGYFQRAIRENPANYAAKLNLEFVLRLSKRDRSRFDARAQQIFGVGKGQSAGPGGSGF